MLIPEQFYCSLNNKYVVPAGRHLVKDAIEQTATGSLKIDIFAARPALGPFIPIWNTVTTSPCLY